MNHVLPLLNDHLTQGRETVLAVVCGRSGSTPRGAGAAMLVHPDGRVRGTIGGGLVEAAAARRAPRILEAGPDAAALQRFDLTGADAAAAGMVCGGNMDVLLQAVRPSDQAREHFASAARILEQEGEALLLTDLGPLDAEERMRVAGRLVLGRETSPDNVPPELAQAARDAVGPGEARLLERQGRRWLAQRLARAHTLILVGAGHVSQHTAEAAARVGFRVVVLDDRAEFANAQRFPQAVDIRVLDSFDDCFQGLDVDQDSYVVVVTRGHLQDRVVLAQALGTRAGYLGMIGSRRKRDAVYAALARDGAAPEDLERVHCPIGLAIKAETPEEIAVSIVAELILARARRKEAGRPA